MDARWARAWFGATAGCVLAGVIVQLIVSANNASVFGGSPVSRALNIFVFFTVDANLIVGATTLLLAVDPDRPSLAFRILRLIGLVSIAVTGIVFHVVLSGLLELDTWAQVANQLLHTVVPILAVAGWIIFGPRSATSARIVRLTFLFPALYMAFTLIRGPLASDFYPYPFADAKALGYFKVVVNGVWISLLFLGLAAAATAVDRSLPGLDERGQGA